MANWRQTSDSNINELICEKIGYYCGPALITITYDGSPHKKFVTNSKLYLKRVFSCMLNDLKLTPKWILEIKEKNGGKLTEEDIRELEVEIEEDWGKS